MLIRPLDVDQDRGWHSLRSDYVEACWTSVLGSSSVALLRLCPVLWLEASPYQVDDLDLAIRIGSRSAGKVRAVAARLDKFGLAHWDPPEGTLDVATSVPELSTGSLERTTDWVRDRHYAMSSMPKPPGPKV